MNEMTIKEFVDRFIDDGVDFRFGNYVPHIYFSQEIRADIVTDYDHYVRYEDLLNNCTMGQVTDIEVSRDRRVQLVLKGDFDDYATENFEDEG